MQWMANRLRKWLLGPLHDRHPWDPAIHQLQARMDTLETLMKALPPSVPLPMPSPLDDPRLADSPDAHLGAQ
jgi:hypothetical protein